DPGLERDREADLRSPVGVRGVRGRGRAREPRALHRAAADHPGCDPVPDLHDLGFPAGRGDHRGSFRGGRRAVALHVRFAVLGRPRDVHGDRADLVLPDADRLSPRDRAGEVPIRALVEPALLPRADLSKAGLRRRAAVPGAPRSVGRDRRRHVRLGLGLLREPRRAVRLLHLGMSAAILLENVSVRYRIPRERTGSLKEYAIRRLKRRLHFDEFEALRDVSLEVPGGESVGVVGRNGAGKSTLLRLIARVMPPSAGRVVVVGRTAPLLELGLGFHGELTGRENIMLQGALLGFTRAEMKRRLDRIVAFAELEEFIDAPMRTYSTGMAARLAFSVATDVDPDILLVDEALAVGDERFQMKCHDRMEAFRQAGKTVLLVSHALAQVRQNCRRAV